MIAHRGQFLDQARILAAQFVASALSYGLAIELQADLFWPSDAVTMGLLDPSRRQAHIYDQARRYNTRAPLCIGAIKLM